MSTKPPTRALDGEPRRLQTVASTHLRDWPGYFKAVAGKEPRETLVKALELSDAPGLAIDLGCGEGRDTVALLARGWRVLAIDGHEMALDLTAHHPRLPAGARQRVELRLAEMETVELPPCDLLNASFSLPFCRPDRFDELWDRIHASIRPGGLFAGQLFGDRDAWASLPDRSHQSRRRVGEMFRGRYQLEHFQEDERDGLDASGNAKHWHLFHVIARRCPDGANPSGQGPTIKTGGTCP